MVVLVHKHPLILVDSFFVAFMKHFRVSVPLFDQWEVLLHIMILQVLFRQLSDSEVVLTDDRLALTDYHEALRFFSFSLNVVTVAIHLFFKV